MYLACIYRKSPHEQQMKMFADVCMCVDMCRIMYISVHVFNNACMHVCISAISMYVCINDHLYTKDSLKTIDALRTTGI